MSTPLTPPAARSRGRRRRLRPSDTTQPRTWQCSAPTTFRPSEQRSSPCRRQDPQVKDCKQSRVGQPHAFRLPAPRRARPILRGGAHSDRRRRISRCVPRIAVATLTPEPAHHRETGWRVREVFPVTPRACTGVVESSLSVLSFSVRLPLREQVEVTPARRSSPSTAPGCRGPAADRAWPAPPQHARRRSVRPGRPAGGRPGLA